MENCPFKVYFIKGEENESNTGEIKSIKELKEKNLKMEKNKIPIFNEKNLGEVSPKFTELTNIKNFSDRLKNFFNLFYKSSAKEEENKKIKRNKIIIEFKVPSEYINLKTFKLNLCVTFRVDFGFQENLNNNSKKLNKNKNKITLDDCLKAFCEEEKLEAGNEWYCKRCKQLTLPVKKIEIFYLPKILIINFKRFIKEKYQWRKNEEDIDFPIIDLNMKDYIIGPDKEHSVYDLFAVSQHYGCTGFGHYTSVCKNLDSWYSYNDSEVRTCQSKDALTSAAYVLFYKRQTD